MSTRTAGSKVNEVNIDEDDDGNVNGHSSKQYLHTGRNEENVEIRGINTEHSRKDPENDDKSFEKEQDEGISLKATKIDVNQGKGKDNKVHAEKEKDDKKKVNPFEKKITYLNATRENLKELKYNGCRIGVSDFMRSKPVDISIIILIIMYTLLVIVYLAVEDEIDKNEEVRLSLQILELVFLAIF
jgi:hypothetical protein